MHVKPSEIGIIFPLIWPLTSVITNAAPGLRGYGGATGTTGESGMQYPLRSVWRLSQCPQGAWDCKAQCDNVLSCRDSALVFCLSQ